MLDPVKQAARRSFFSIRKRGFLIYDRSKRNPSTPLPRKNRDTANVVPDGFPVEIRLFFGKKDEGITRPVVHLFHAGAEKKLASCLAALLLALSQNSSPHAAPAGFSPNRLNTRVRPTLVHNKVRMMRIFVMQRNQLLGVRHGGRIRS
jgi:hypothetical protein